MADNSSGGGGKKFTDSKAFHYAIQFLIVTGGALSALYLYDYVFNKVRTLPPGTTNA